MGRWRPEAARIGGYSTGSRAHCDPWRSGATTTPRSTRGMPTWRVSRRRLLVLRAWRSLIDHIAHIDSVASSVGGQRTLLVASARARASVRSDAGREVLACEGQAGGDEVSGCALEGDPAAVVAGTRAEVAFGTLDGSSGDFNRAPRARAAFSWSLTPSRPDRGTSTDRGRRPERWRGGDARPGCRHAHETTSGSVGAATLDSCRGTPSRRHPL
jgi:hypothetical protein